MTEKLLHFIWQNKYFDLKEMLTAEEQPLAIINSGIYNMNQGPDFINARIKIGNTEWAGSIELHVHASEWQQHGHSTDKNYANVILHVVWMIDREISLPFPTLELQHRVSSLFLSRYNTLMQDASFIPCEKLLYKLPLLTLVAWKDRLLIERLQRKSTIVMHLLKESKQHWEEVLWWMLAGNFGLKINKVTFEQMAKTIPFNIIAKLAGRPLQLEALLMGQSGLLEGNFSDEYPAILKKEYQFLSKKYTLEKNHNPVFFLRMRPAAFPGIKLSQLCAIFQKQRHIFSILKETENLSAIKEIFSVSASNYWDTHYVFDAPSAYSKKSPGKQMINNILINTIIPVMYTYETLHNQPDFPLKSLRWMTEIEAEKNNITRGFETLGFENITAMDSQAFIELKNNYCDQKLCLHCAIGNKIIGANTQM